MKIAIVENESAEAEKLKKYIEKYSIEKQCMCQTITFYNGVDFLTEYTGDFDAVFLDIQMPMMDGIETAEKLRLKDDNVQIIFVTNMAQFAIKGYQVRALDFLVKPVTFFDISLELDKLMRICRNSSDNFLWINSGGSFMRVLFDDITYIEILRHDVYVHMRKQVVSFRGTLKELEPKLDKNIFSRPDNCYIVNMYYIKKIQGEFIYLDGGEELHISRTRKKQFMTDFTNYVNRSGGGVC